MGHENRPRKRRSPAGSSPDEPEAAESEPKARSRRPSSERSVSASVRADASAGGLPDLLRRAMAMGLSGFFTTEEALRKALGDTVPRDWIDFANDQSERTRAELMQRMSEEFGRVLEKTDLAEVMERLIEGRTIEVTAQIRLGDRNSAGSSKRKTGDRVADDSAEDS